eukprot:TRINITY_DN28709_c0_g1_i1.p1 TRINITY_DN28709_c0_g1~~TRINITY_DN28709_c0_g1_i1.p1  ORF type:complete len:251 (+),score=67.95 TRINITY_DN28709_c0_g1_i1:85-837(+)
MFCAACCDSSAGQQIENTVVPAAEPLVLAEQFTKSAPAAEAAPTVVQDEGKVVTEVATPAAEAAPAPAEFTVTLSGPNHGLSINMLNPDALLIGQVLSAGGAATWNKSCKESEKLMKMDRIMKVDGHTGTSPELAKELSEPKEHVLTIKRPKELQIVVDTNEFSQSLGVSLKFEPEATEFLGFLILAVKEDGAMKAHNDKNPDKAVGVSDRIVGIQSASGVFVAGQDDMVQALKDAKTSGKLSIKVHTWA